MGYMAFISVLVVMTAVVGVLAFRPFQATQTLTSQPAGGAAMDNHEFTVVPCPFPLIYSFNLLFWTLCGVSSKLTVVANGRRYRPVLGDSNENKPMVGAEEEEVAKMGCPSLGEHTQMEVVIEESYEFKVSFPPGTMDGAILGHHSFFILLASLFLSGEQRAVNELVWRVDKVNRPPLALASPSLSSLTPSAKPANPQDAVPVFHLCFSSLLLAGKPLPSDFVTNRSLLSSCMIFVRWHVHVHACV